MSAEEYGEQEFVIELQQVEGYEFRVRFDGEGVPDLATDEQPPLGQGAGPSPSRLLAAAIGNCLGASLLFCLAKSRVPGASVHATVTGRMRRNDAGRWRIAGFQVQLQVNGVEEPSRARLMRCVDLFEPFCIVTESVRRGIPVAVEVIDPTASY